METKDVIVDTGGVPLVEQPTDGAKYQVKHCVFGENIEHNLATKMISSLLARAIISQEAATKGEQQKNAPRGPRISLTTQSKGNVCIQFSPEECNVG